MHKPLTILCLGLLLPFLSCIRETSRGDAFEVCVQPLTDSFFDGDEFGFTVRSNRAELRVLDFSFPPDPDLVTKDHTYPTTDGIWSVRKRITVPSTHQGRLSISLQDPLTFLVKDFTFTYHAYASTGVALTIDNPPITSKYLSLGLPAVVSGDDFLFTLHARAPRLILRDFRCEFNDGEILYAGKEFLMGDGRLPLRIPSVATEDCFSPKTLSLSLLDPDTGRDTTVTAQYVTAARFAPEVSLLDSHLLEGEKTYVRLTANRPRFHLKGYTAPTWFVLKDYSPSDPLVSLNLDGYQLMETLPLEMGESGSGELHFELYDNEYTLRSELVSVPYTAAVKNPPSSVVLSGKDYKIAAGETVSVSVTTSGENSSNRFVARIISGDASTVGLYAPVASETAEPDAISSERFSDEAEITAGKLYIRGLGGWGPLTVRVFAKGRESVHRDITLYVRRDVALRLKGAFRDEIHYWPDQIDAIFSDLGNGSEGVGWYGLPQSLEAELVSWENRSTRELTDLRKEEVPTYVKCFSLSDGSVAPLEVAFIVSVGSKVTSRFFYGSYKDYADPRSRLITGTDIDRTVSATLPLQFNTRVGERRATGNKVACPQLRALLRDLDCKADYQHGYGLFVMFRETLRSDDQMGFGSFDVSLSGVDYDRDRYRVRYVFNMLEVPGESGETLPWWKDVPGERPWITPFTD